jgi:hypothetical protein
MLPAFQIGEDSTEVVSVLCGVGIAFRIKFAEYVVHPGLFCNGIGLR